MRIIPGLAMFANWPAKWRDLFCTPKRTVTLLPDHISRAHLPGKLHSGQKAEKRSAENLELLLEDYERRVITETLKRNDCNVARTSEALGLGSRQTLV